MCKVITVSNQKGGTAKTTTCVNLGIGLAREGKRVLVIDADPQGSLTISLGYSDPDGIPVLNKIPRTWKSYLCGISGERI